LTQKSGEHSLHELISEFGTPPPPVPRKDNVNIELLLLNKYRGPESVESKEMKPEQIYTETKYLLFTIIKAIPKISETTENDIKALLQEAQKYASEQNDFQLADKVKKIHQNCKKN